MVYHVEGRGGDLYCLIYFTDTAVCRMPAPCSSDELQCCFITFLCLKRDHETVLLLASQCLATTPSFHNQNLIQSHITTYLPGRCIAQWHLRVNHHVRRTNILYRPRKKTKAHSHSILGLLALLAISPYTPFLPQ